VARRAAAAASSRARLLRTFSLPILKATASRFSDSSIRFGRPSSVDCQLPGYSGEPAPASGGLFAYPTPQDCSGQRVSASFLSAGSRESPAAKVRGWTLRIDAGIRQTRAPNSEVDSLSGAASASLGGLVTSSLMLYMVKLYRSCTGLSLRFFARDQPAVSATIQPNIRPPTPIRSATTSEARSRAAVEIVAASAAKRPSAARRGERPGQQRYCATARRSAGPIGD
jgi:hypothetical protein